MAFNESNTVEAYLADALAGSSNCIANRVEEPSVSYLRTAKGTLWVRMVVASIKSRTRGR